MQLRKTDLDPRIAKLLPPGIIDAPDQGLGLVRLVLPGWVSIFAAILVSAVAKKLGLDVFLPALVISIVVGGFIIWKRIPASQQRFEQSLTVNPERLREFGKKHEASDVVESEYCLLVAALAATSTVPEDMARCMLADTNTLIAAYHELVEQEVFSETLMERKESIQQTFRALRKSIKQVQSTVAVSADPSTASAIETVDIITERLYTQVRNIEQATSEVQSLRH